MNNFDYLFFLKVILTPGTRDLWSKFWVVVIIETQTEKSRPISSVFILIRYFKLLKIKKNNFQNTMKVRFKHVIAYL